MGFFLDFLLDFFLRAGDGEEDEEEDEEETALRADFFLRFVDLTVKTLRVLAAGFARMGDNAAPHLPREESDDEDDELEEAEDESESDSSSFFRFFEDPFAIWTDLSRSSRPKKGVREFEDRVQVTSTGTYTKT